MEFQQLNLKKMIATAVKELGVSRAFIFREAGMHPTSFLKWKGKVTPNRGSENKIVKAIQRIQSKQNKSNPTRPVNGQLSNVK